MAEKRTVTGSLGTDPERKEFDNGSSIASFRLGENTRRKNRETGQWEDGPTTWYDVAVNNDQLRENVMASVQKRDVVTVYGNYKAEAYINGDGQAEIGHKIYADEVAASYKQGTYQRGPSVNVNRSGPEQGVDRGVDQNAPDWTGPSGRQAESAAFNPDAAAQQREVQDREAARTAANVERIRQASMISDEAKEATKAQIEQENRVGYTGPGNQADMGQARDMRGGQAGQQAPAAQDPYADIRAAGGGAYVPQQTEQPQRPPAPPRISGPSGPSGPGLV